MNTDISRMIALQKHHDRLRDAEASIVSIKASQKDMEKEIIEMEGRLDTMEKNVKDLKNDIKKNELELQERDQRLSLLNNRKSSAQNEKELTAIEKEISSVREDISQLEESALGTLDSLETEESRIVEIKTLLETKKIALQSRIPENKAKIDSCEAVITDNKERFNSITENLSPQVKSRFLKMISSKEGKAIATVNGDICGFCNCKIPLSLSMESSRDDRVVNCTNCGRFIYSDK